jgi:Zn2+/Cd2+-exporting ATPase
VSPESDVFNGSINLEGLLKVRVKGVGDQTTLGRVIALMQEAENIKPAVTRLLERYAGGYMALVLLLTASLWFITGSSTVALAVLVASCPCALVLAAPATSIAAIAVASRHGILVKGSGFLEQLANVNAIAFDKTGTLTVGELRLVGNRTPRRCSPRRPGAVGRKSWSGQQPSGEPRRRACRAGGPASSGGRF